MSDTENSCAHGRFSSRRKGVIADGVWIIRRLPSRICSSNPGACKIPGKVCLIAPTLVSCDSHWRSRRRASTSR